MNKFIKLNNKYYPIYKKNIKQSNSITQNIPINNINSINQQNNNTIRTNNTNNTNNYDTNYLNKLDDFSELYKINKNNILDNKINEYRYFCYKYLDYIRNIKLPELELNLEKEAILIEFRPFVHLEFILRNAINKIGNDWSYTIVCGNINYDLIKNFCDNTPQGLLGSTPSIERNISKNIKIIKLNYNNINRDDYNKLLYSSDFWNLFIGEKLLIYQDDSCIFKNNINDFINYDYIGAPWNTKFNLNSNVGNGGFSIRTKKIMLQITNLIKDEVSNKLKKNINLRPEDIFFSNYMIDNKIGIVADYDIALKFSIETIYYNDPLGMHQMWLCDNNWKKRMYDNIIKL